MASEEEPKEQKPLINVPTKSSMEILSELFESFDAEPPLIIKKEKGSSPSKKSKKSKKKHKHKDKKHKKKDKKRKRESSASSGRSEIDLAEILIKQEKETSEKKIKIEGTDLSFNFTDIKIKREKETPSDLRKEPDSEELNSNGTEKEKSKTIDKVDGIKKIEIKLKTSSLEALKKSVEDGELSHSDESSSSKKHKKRKHKSDHEKSKRKRKSRSRSRSRSPEKKHSVEDLRNKLNNRHKSKEKRSRSRETRHRDDDFYRKSREDDFYKSKDRDDFYRTKDKEDDFFRTRDKSRDYKSREKEKYKDSDHKSRRDSVYKDEDSRKSKDDRYRSRYDRDKEKRRRDRSGSRDDPSYIDKKKLLEIARKNAIQMMKSGSLPGALTLGPQAQEKVIAAIKAGGKTIEELTDFCKTLSKQEEMGDLSSNPEDNASDSDTDKPFHHPFQIKDRPTSITMNIKNSVPLPTKTTQERSTELRMQFPVSSGQLHRKTESEWVPVSPKKPDPTAKNFVSGGSLVKPDVPVIVEPAKEKEIAVAAIPVPAPAPVPDPIPAPVAPVVAPVVPVTPGPQIMPVTATPTVDISSIVSQRLSAMRKLQENPNDVQALSEIYKSNKEMQTWAQSKQQPGQFTGSTGAQILSQAELSSGFQAWAKKDQLTSATPVSGGMGMHLLQKMGWKPGEGLGKEKTGALEPLLLEVKLDKKGLVANEEQKKKKKQQMQTWTTKSLQSKHPVSLLGEYASKKKLGAPQYNLCFECGPDHKKNFLFQVILNGLEYKPNVASPNKKEAKALAASVCLQHLGLLPPTTALPPQQ